MRQAHTGHYSWYARSSLLLLLQKGLALLSPAREPMAQTQLGEIREVHRPCVFCCSILVSQGVSNVDRHEGAQDARRTITGAMVKSQGLDQRIGEPPKS